MRVRFAPSPTGHLHVGNARTALFNWLLAHRHGGSFVLRIEDTDVERSTPASEKTILEDLRWLGLDWHEGPDVGGPYGPYRQSERLSLYRSHAERLIATGAAYYCFCSIERLQADRQAALAAGHIPKYSGRCRAIPPDAARRRVEAGEPAAIRFAVPRDLDEISFNDLVRGVVSFKTETVGDPVLVRSDGHPAYNFAVVVDDLAMKITLIVRGEDHISNTPRQLLIYRALGFTIPEFAHLAMVLGPDHSRLSKRHGATSVAEFRALGYLPEALVNYLALLSWSPGGGDELLPLRELAQRFALEDVGKSAGVFDPEKLAWVNRHYLKTSDVSRLVELALPYFERAGMATTPSSDGMAFLRCLVLLARDGVDRLNQIPDRVAFVFRFNVGDALAQPGVQTALADAGAREVIVVLADELAQRPRLDKSSFRAAVERVKQQTGRKAAALFHPIRIALTGQTAGPELDAVVPAIDRGAVLPSDSGIVKIIGCRERALAVAEALADR